MLDSRSAEAKVPLPGIIPSAPLGSPEEPVAEDAALKPPLERTSSASSETKAPPLAVPRRALPPRKKPQPKVPEPTHTTSVSAPDPEAVVINAADETSELKSTLSSTPNVESQEPKTSLDSQLSEEAESPVNFNSQTESSMPEHDSLSPIQYSPSDERLAVPRRMSSPDSATLDGTLSSVLINTTASIENLALGGRSDRPIVREDLDSHGNVEESDLAQPTPGLPPPPTKIDTGEAALKEPEVNPYSPVLRQDNETQDESLSPTPHGIPLTPKRTRDASIPLSCEPDLQPQPQADEKPLSPSSPPVNRSTRPPVPRPRTPTSPMSSRSNTKRSSVQSIPSRSASMEVPLSTRPTRRTTLPPPPPTVAQEPESLEQLQEEYMDQADTGTE